MEIIIQEVCIQAIVQLDYYIVNASGGTHTFSYKPPSGYSITKVEVYSGGRHYWWGGASLD